jgi:hypothetical protein
MARVLKRSWKIGERLGDAKGSADSWHAAIMGKLGKRNWGRRRDDEKM